MRGHSKTLIGFATIVGLGLLLFVYVFVPASLSPHFSRSVVEVTVPRGSGLGQIADILAQKGLVRSELLFKSYVVLLGRQHQLKAGTYHLSLRMSINDLTVALTEGSPDEEISVTIYEGSNVNEIDEILAKTGLIKRGGLLTKAYIDHEGYFFPDTYRFVKDSSFEQIIRTLENTFYEKTNAVLFGYSQAERQRIITIASILEKEVRKPEDMALVAGLIQNRLKRHMPLALDATVAYGVCREQFLVGKPCDVTQVNLIKAISEKGPYNTYKNQGLPPGPISNPGLASINAAINPKANDYLYYLTDRSTGNTIFSKTAIEHERNRQKYILGR